MLPPPWQCRLGRYASTETSAIIRHSPTCINSHGNSAWTSITCLLCICFGDTCAATTWVYGLTHGSEHGMLFQDPEHRPNSYPRCTYNEQCYHPRNPSTSVFLEPFT